jgi:hypothetical protein
VAAARRAAVVRSCPGSDGRPAAGRYEAASGMGVEVAPAQPLGAPAYGYSTVAGSGSPPGPRR